MVSVITATVGRDNLPKTCKMIDEQTYEDWEHVVVYDGQAAEQASGLPLLKEGIPFRNEKRNCVVIEKSKHDHGKTPQNVGLVASRGEFVTLLDDDNEWLPKHLECMMKPFEDLTIQIVLCPLTMIHFNHGNRREERHFSISQGKVDAGNWIARREVLYRNGLFWAPHRRSYDWELLKKILTETKEKYKVIEDRNFLYYTPKP